MSTKSDYMILLWKERSANGWRWRQIRGRKTIPKVIWRATGDIPCIIGKTGECRGSATIPVVFSFPWKSVLAREIIGPVTEIWGFRLKSFRDDFNRNPHISVSSLRYRKVIERSFLRDLLGIPCLEKSQLKTRQLNAMGLKRKFTFWVTRKSFVNIIKTDWISMKNNN